VNQEDRKFTAFVSQKRNPVLSLTVSSSFIIFRFKLMTEQNNYVGSAEDLKFPQISNAHRGDSANASKQNPIPRQDSFHS
jgi:hypothetical protein